MQTEEWLARLAALGRSSAPLTLPLLAGKLQASLARLQQLLQTCGEPPPVGPALRLLLSWQASAMSLGGLRQCAHACPACSHPLRSLLSAGEDPSVALEQLCWLTTMCGYVLADDGEGETPLVPLPVAQACEAAAAAAAAASNGGSSAVPDPAEQLSSCLLAVGAHCLAQAGQLGASPRLLEVAAASLGRWADTYLMASEGASGCAALAASFGPGGAGGFQAAQMLVSLALTALTQYHGERALHEVSWR